MAKIRGIKPEVWTDDKFVRLSPLARLLFIGMWNIACDNGHVEDNHVQLKMRLLPMDSCDVNELVDEMIATGQVERNGGWLKVLNLVEHQRVPDKRFLTLCARCAHDVHAAYFDEDRLPRGSSATDPGVTGTQRAHGEHTASTHSAHSGEPEPEPEPEPDQRASADAERGGSTRGEQLETDFAEWYAEYPRKKARGQALKAYKAARKKVDHQTLVDGLHSHLPDFRQRAPEKIPYPATWLNGECWDDEPDSSGNVLPFNGTRYNADGSVDESTLPPLPPKTPWSQQ